MINLVVKPSSILPICVRLGLLSAGVCHVSYQVNFVKPFGYLEHTMYSILPQKQREKCQFSGAWCLQVHYFKLSQFESILWVLACICFRFPMVNSLVLVYGLNGCVCRVTTFFLFLTGCWIICIYYFLQNSARINASSSTMTIISVVFGSYVIDKNHCVPWPFELS